MRVPGFRSVPQLQSPRHPLRPILRTGALLEALAADAARAVVADGREDAPQVGVDVVFAVPDRAVGAADLAFPTRDVKGLLVERGEREADEEGEQEQDPEPARAGRQRDEPAFDRGRVSGWRDRGRGDAEGQRLLAAALAPFPRRDRQRYLDRAPPRGGHLDRVPLQLDAESAGAIHRGQADRDLAGVRVGEHDIVGPCSPTAPLRRRKGQANSRGAVDEQALVADRRAGRGRRFGEDLEGPAGVRWVVLGGGHGQAYRRRASGGEAQAGQVEGVGAGAGTVAGFERDRNLALAAVLQQHLVDRFPGRFDLLPGEAHRDRCRGEDVLAGDLVGPRRRVGRRHPRRVPGVARAGDRVRTDRVRLGRQRQWHRDPVVGGNLDPVRTDGDGEAGVATGRGDRERGATARDVLDHQLHPLRPGSFHRFRFQAKAKIGRAGLRQLALHGAGIAAGLGRGRGDGEGDRGRRRR
ncbi:MAG: hypothetical protein AVDCRST_MAG73-716 [uncultured Thermomicrobiales bacterium]|uniref:Uncharacterized protein n=1 Tax=uncultured Thermomicrobiales bacterium TaxID=1645740 RepID=A0A6J4TQ91_9BACT|nr:MAG: hypothetical protein AVDCRST_MAG73-716 [uncultured Thermomicrobiales bacterium]